VIALYIEGIRKGRAFIEAARRIVPHKPIVAYYIGGSEGGRKAGFSHTGALAGPDPLYNGVFQQSGIIRARTIEELFDFCWVLGSCPVPSGNNVIIQTHSGGPGAAAADACDRSSLRVSSLQAGTLEKLRAYIPHTGSVDNPVDLTFSKNPLDYFHSIPKILLEDETGNGLLIYFLIPARMVHQALEGMGIPKEKIPEQAEQVIQNLADSVSSLREKQEKPVFGFSFRGRDDSLILALQDKGIPVLPSPERAAAAMGALVKYSRFREKLTAAAPWP
jgi:acyl-CoA synthetase (NDP forming)